MKIVVGIIVFVFFIIALGILITALKDGRDKPCLALIWLFGQCMIDFVVALILLGNK